MKKRFIALCVAVLLAIPFFAEETIVLKVGTIAPPRSPWDTELKKLSSEWQRITNGKVRIRFQDMTILGGEKAGIEKMKPPRPGQRAPLDGGVFTSVGLHEFAPEARIFTLSIPFLVRTQNELEHVIDKFGKDIENKFYKRGGELLAWTNVGWLTFYTKDNYNDLKGLKQLKIACSGIDSPVLSNTLKVSGFTVEDVPAQKFLQSLKSKNGINGFFNVPMGTYVTGFYKDVNYALDLQICPVIAGFVLSNEAWARIPEKYKPEMVAALDDTIARLNANLDVYDKEFSSKLTKAGLKNISLTDDQVKQWDKEFTADMYRAARAYPEAIDVKMYSDIQKVLEIYRK